MVAFTGEYDGSVDVFVVPAAGGVPKRLTHHPSSDYVVGWTPDSKRVLFGSTRENWASVGQLFTVSVEGGFPEKLPLPHADSGALSPDGGEIAYLQLPRADQIWKRYRGGRAAAIWIAKLADSSVTMIPRKDSNDYSPMWIGNSIYFLSDRNGKVTLFRYDTRSKQVAQAIENNGLDLKSASAGPGGIVYEQFGAIHTYDLKTGKSQAVNITLNGDLPEVRPRMEKVSRWMRNAAISPSGARAVFEARGEIFTVPAEKGNARNITNTKGVAERSPAWSPDGKWIAFFSDESGEYMLHLAPQNGIGETQKISLGTPPSFFYSPEWSPDSKKIAYSDKRLNLWYIDIEKKTPVKVDVTTYADSQDSFEQTWSPDSKWIAYSKQLKNHLSAVCLYNVDTAQATQITDGMGDANSPAWDKNGKYLYLMVSTDSGPQSAGLDLSSNNRPVSRSIYAVVLSKSEPSPLAPESDEEKGEEKKPDAKPAAKVEVKIDLDGILQRTIPLPMPARNYSSVKGAKTGILYVLEAPRIPEPGSFGPGGPALTLQKFDLSKRKTEKFADGVAGFTISANGEKLLMQQGQNWTIASATAPLKPGEGRLRFDEMEMQVDPAAEWKQMYREVLRLERDYFYDPNHHGLDIQALGERYEKYLRNLSSRGDLNYLWREMLGELTVGHLYVTGGDTPQANQVQGGLLGADYKVENGRYRVAKVYNGENWNPNTRAPLTQPGVNVAAGDYILAVNGKELRGSDEIYALFEATAGKNTILKVGADPNGTNAREVTVQPLPSELQLRRLDWLESNRRKVDQLSGGKLAYVYLPDTANGGLTYFNRYYFAQSDRQGLVIDERFNSGGQAADYVIDHLRRPVWSYWSSRDGQDYTTPANNITGPKVMIINEAAGSGGDMLPWMFRRAKLGPLVGKRTWGGLVGIGGYPTLIDGGYVTAPHFAFWNPDGKWDVENHGTAPDVEVDLDPKQWREGRDTQLEKAVQLAMEMLEKNPPAKPVRPPYPVYQPKGAIATGGGK